MVFHEPNVIFLQEYLIWWLVFHDIACVLDYLYGDERGNCLDF